MRMHMFTCFTYSFFQIHYTYKMEWHTGLATAALAAGKWSGCDYSSLEVMNFQTVTSTRGIMCAVRLSAVGSVTHPQRHTQV